MSSSTYEIALLGGSVAGLGIAHYLLRHTIPALSEATGQTYRLTLVTPSQEFFWKYAAVRAAVNPALLAPEKLFCDFTKEFETYPSSSYRFIQGEANHVDPESKKIIVKTRTTEETISYDSLVIATGANSKSPLWNYEGDESKSKAAFKTTAEQVAKAKTIYIVGGGATGVETAGEAGFAFGKKAEITLLSGGERLLPRLAAHRGASAEAKLSNLGVKTRHNLRIKNQSGAGPYTLTLTDDSTVTVDTIIDSTGTFPNTSFLPPAWLNEKGFVQTDNTTLRANAPSLNSDPDSRIYAIGDVASYSLGRILDAQAVRPLAESIRLDIASAHAKKNPSEPKKPTPTSFLARIPVAGSLFSKPPVDPLSLERKPGSLYAQLSPSADMQFVTIGPQAGVAAVFGFSIPSFIVAAVKGKTIFVEKIKPTVAGDDYVTA